jgi:alpha-beta hydrolase superfamily lysophospholipase
MEVPVDSEAIPLWERRTAGWIVQRLWLRDRRGGPWDPPSDLDWEDVRFTGNTGARIAGRYFRALNAKGVVVTAHPDKRYAGHWFVRTGWVHLLTRSGLDVLTFDLTGYGNSHGPATYYAEDIHHAIRYIRRTRGDLPVHVFGVSMGAFAAAIASPWMHDVDGLVLESPYPNIARWYGGGLGAVVSRAFDAVFRKTGRLLQADKRIKNAAAKRILVAASAVDDITPATLSKTVAQNAPADRTRYIELDEAPHLHLYESDDYRRAVLEAFGVRETPIRVPPTATT